MTFFLLLPLFRLYSAVLIKECDGVSGRGEGEGEAGQKGMEAFEVVAGLDGIHPSLFPLCRPFQLHILRTFLPVGWSWVIKNSVSRRKA
jgi:hypothetical protein